MSCYANDANVVSWPCCHWLDQGCSTRRARGCARSSEWPPEAVLVVLAPGALVLRPWNSLVSGEDQGDGWLRVPQHYLAESGVAVLPPWVFQVADGRYLPMRLNGVSAADFAHHASFPSYAHARPSEGFPVLKAWLHHVRVR